jgi:hypothetical protein
MSDVVLNQRIDDLIKLLGPHGYNGSRIEVIRRAIFALPTEDQEHLARLVQYGGLRWREASGLGWSEDALAHCEGLLYWWNEDADRAKLIAHAEDLQRRLDAVVGALDKVRAVGSGESDEWWRL